MDYLPLGKGRTMMTNLTPRQIEIDRLLAAGTNPLAVCGRLRITGETFRAEIQAIETNRTTGYMCKGPHPE
jgi:hypothetical protein